MIVRKTALTGLIGLSLSLGAAASGIPRLPAEFGSSSFIITAVGELYAWGYNQGGQLGIGTAASPVQAPLLVRRPEGVRSWQAVAPGQRSVAIGDDGNLYNWGRTNHSSSSGPFQLTPILLPKPHTVSRWQFVASGDLNQPIAIAEDGNLYQWDYRPVPPLLVPKPEGVTSWRKVSTGRSYYLALADNGELFEWGPPSAATPEIAPRKVARPTAVTRWIDASSGIHHGLALGDNGELYQQDYTPGGRFGQRPRVGGENRSRGESVSTQPTYRPKKSP